MTMLETAGDLVIPASRPLQAQALAQEEQQIIDLLVTDGHARAASHFVRPRFGWTIGFSP